MANLISCATGNLTAATTWALVDSTSVLITPIANMLTSTALTTAYSGTQSNTFTPGAITIDGIAVHVASRSASPSGTIGVILRNTTDSTDVSGSEVLLDVADLPVSQSGDKSGGGWVFFKFSAPITLTAAKAYAVRAKTSSSTMVNLTCGSSNQNLNRMLRTTTTQAPAAGDDMHIMGEHTGQGTGNDFVVTMDSTAATDYGSATGSITSGVHALTVSQRGTLEYGTTSSTNYILRLSGNLTIHCNGVFNMGTTGTPMPRSSTAVLEFDCPSDAAFGLNLAGGTTSIQGLSRTSGNNSYYCKLNTDEAAGQTVLGVDTDTGWLNGDAIAIASTSRTYSEIESRTLSADATATTLTVSSGLTNAHLGTSPTQAEVILLTRNVIVRSTSSTLCSYVRCHPLATIDIDWAEIYYMGGTTGTAGNNPAYTGITVTTETGSFDIQNSCIHDSENHGIVVAGTSANNITISNNSFYNCSVGTSSYALSIGSTTNTNITASNNIVMGGAGSSSTQAAIFVGVRGITFNNNVVTSINKHGIQITLATILTGSFANNTAHSNAQSGIYITGAVTESTFTNTTCWRNNTYGISLGGAMMSNTFDGVTLFGNNTAGIGSNGNSFDTTFENCISNGGSTLVQARGFRDGGHTFSIRFIDSDFGVTTTHSSDDISYNSVTSSLKQIECINCRFATSTEFSTLADSVYGLQSYLRSHKHDQGSEFRNYYKYGNIFSNTTTRHTASGYSWAMTPTSATYKLILPGPTTSDVFKAAANSGALVTITAWVQKDGSYNGNAPRLVLVGGIVAGITSNVTASLTVGASTWEQLTVTGTPSEDGVIEFYVDCDGTAGNVFVDDIGVSQA